MHFYYKKVKCSITTVRTTRKWKMFLQLKHISLKTPGSAALLPLLEAPRHIWIRACAHVFIYQVGDRHFWFGLFLFDTDEMLRKRSQYSRLLRKAVYKEVGFPTGKVSYMVLSALSLATPMINASLLRPDLAEKTRTSQSLSSDASFSHLH